MVIAGSNLYNKNPGVLRIPGFVGPRGDVYNNAAFDVPVEPIGNYDTQISQDIFYYNTTLTKYDAEFCASVCSEWTDRAFDAYPGPFVDGAFPVCSMFVAYELRKDNKPRAMVCDTFASVWSSHYQTIQDNNGMEITKVSVYQRDDYQFKAICALREHCAEDEWYAGGDCSG